MEKLTYNENISLYNVQYRLKNIELNKKPCYLENIDEEMKICDIFIF
jgi:hypothetical protein